MIAPRESVQRWRLSILWEIPVSEHQVSSFAGHAEDATPDAGSHDIKASRKTAPVTYRGTTGDVRKETSSCAFSH